MRKTALRLVLFYLSLLFALQATAEDQWQGVQRIVAVGDVHGDFEHFVDVLRNAGLINRRRNWIAEDTHFVQVGDLPDRGPDTDKIIELMQKLEEQAERAGGMVHALLGNHEVMNIYGDLRYVHPGEYEALRSGQSRRLRNDFYDRYVAQVLANDPEATIDDALRDQFNAQVPLGFVEHRAAWSTRGPFGSWVVGHNTVIKINRTLFLHGGIAPDVVGKSIREINDQIKAELQGGGSADALSGGAGAGQPSLSETETGPLWYRGLAQNDEAAEQANLDAVLEFYDVDRIVLGHTPSLSTILPRFDGKVILIDTGISEYYGGQLGSLLIENNELIALQRGETFKIPTGEEPLLPYFKAILEVESKSSSLQQIILNLETPPGQSTPQ